MIMQIASCVYSLLGVRHHIEIQLIQHPSHSLIVRSLSDWDLPFW